MFSFEASTLPGPLGLPLRNRFQELVSDDECEDETDLQQQLPCCSATTTHDEKKILKVIPRVGVPMTPSMSFVNPLIAEPVDTDIDPLVSKITTVMDSGASHSSAPPSLAPEVERDTRVCWQSYWTEVQRCKW